MSDTIDSIINDNSDDILYNTDPNKIYLHFNNIIIPFEQEKKIIKIILKSQYPYSNIKDDVVKKIKKINYKITSELLNSSI